jgi:hypothetical protein
MFLKLYMDSFGSMYSRQLDKHLPQAFLPTFPVEGHPQWKHLADRFEPVYSSLRNWMYHEGEFFVYICIYISEHVGTEHNQA